MLSILIFQNTKKYSWQLKIEEDENNANTLFYFILIVGILWVKTLIPWVSKSFRI